MSSLAERIKKKAQTEQASRSTTALKLPDDIEFFKPHKGHVLIDILPYIVKVDYNPDAKRGEEWFKRDYFAHYNVGPDERTIVCPRSIGKPCPICEEHKRLRRIKGTDEELLKGMRAKERELYNVVDLTQDERVVQVMEISRYNFGATLFQELREGSESNVNFADLENGMSLEIRFAEASMGKTTYLEASRIDFKPRKRPYKRSILEVTADLDACLVVLPYDEIYAMFMGVDAHEAKRELTETAPAPKRRVIEDDDPAPAEHKEEPKKPSRAVVQEEPDEDPKPAAKAPRSVEDDDPPAKKPAAGGDDEPCVACSGSGKNSKGRMCMVCSGTGKNGG